MKNFEVVVTFSNWQSYDGGPFDYFFSPCTEEEGRKLADMLKNSETAREEMSRMLNNPPGELSVELREYVEPTRLPTVAEVIQKLGSLKV